MKRYCVIGSPIAHSLSPAMHNAAFAALELNKQAHYEAVEVMPNELENFMSVFAQQYAGMNVTIPHKEAVMKYLDEVDDCARTIGAVNTVKVDGGKLIGYNTDWSGFTAALLEGIQQKSHLSANEQTSVKTIFQHKPVLVVGAGGAARAVCFALSQLGAQLYVTNRTIEKAQKLAHDFRGVALSHDKLASIEPSLVVNVTSLGMNPHEFESPVSVSLWQKWKHSKITQYSFDCVYNPLNTQFLKDSISAGFVAITGDGMLVHQGSESFELFTGKKAPIEAMKKAVVVKL